MLQTYLRPISLVYGSDARALIAAGEAGALGGMDHIGFTHAEEVARDGKTVHRTIKAFRDIEGHPLTTEITRKRGVFGGVDLGASRLMGIVNVTPDSFSDGGRHYDEFAAIAQGQKLAEQGADILDVGGESTRPGSNEVAIDVERLRIMPVVSALAKDHRVSVDTRKSLLMDEALVAGAAMINDVSALGFDTKSAGVISQHHAPIIIMHAQGEPRTMQLAPKYQDVVLDVYDWLAERIAFAVAAGIPKSRICIDPGIGFGKTIQHNLELLRNLTIFHSLGVGVLIGLSRKNMVGVLTGEKTAEKRVAGSVGGALHAAMHGAHILRVHDVLETFQALTVFNAAQDPDLASL